MLDYNLDGIGMPLKVYLFTSLDGKEYRLASIKDTPHFPNNRHDAWIENLLFDQLDESIRYKIKTSGAESEFVFINGVAVSCLC